MHCCIGGVALAQGFRLPGMRQAAGLSTGCSTAGFRVRRLRASAFGDRRDGVSPHPHRGSRKWFAAAWLMAQDKRGVSALFLARELALRYDTAWLIAHKLRHGPSERNTP